MKIKITILFCLLSQVAFSQTLVKTIIDNGGASVYNADLQMVYTIGEVNVQEAAAGNISISEGFISANLLSSAVYIPDPNFEGALIEQGIDSKGIPDHLLLRSDAEAVHILDVSSREIEDLTGIEAFVNLVSLSCSDNLLSSLDVSNNVALLGLYCDHNQISNLILPENPAFASLHCNENQLTELDLSAYSQLGYLNCSDNLITDLNIENSTAITKIYCYHNDIPSLDVTLFTDLTHLWCYGNELTELDVSNNIELLELMCHNNQLTSLDVSYNTKLTRLECFANQLEELNVKMLPDLFWIRCGVNPLTELDLSQNTSLNRLECNLTDLVHIDMRNGNNHNVISFNATNNANLTCISVDDEMADHSDWLTDPGVILSNDCDYNTQRGESVAVLPVDETTETTPVEVTFNAVDLSGNTSLVTGEAGPEIPGGFTFGEPLTYYDISTTADFSGPVQIAIDYSGMIFANEEGLRLMHYESDQWIDVTTMLDTENDMIYGEVMILSPFGILEDIEPPVFSETSDIIINNPGPTGAIVEFDIPTATDNSPGVIVEQTDGTGLTSGSFFPLGVTTLSYLATDVAGNTATCSFDVILNNLPPVIDEIIAPVDPIPLGSEAGVTVLFTDDNLVEATIDWGDGIDIVYGDIIDQSIVWNYTYPSPGVYAVSIQLVDIGGKTAEETYRYIVVFDPAGGFVTGGGWINSPPGAYVDDPLLEGKANFGFVSKYKKGKDIPEGNAEFQFNTGNLKFKSTSYYWMVIAGSKAKFKGDGTVNNAGDYGFLISAIDGDLKDNGEDRFRIKIWDMADEAVIYDNEIEKDENEDPATELGGGSIVIHTSKTKGSDIFDGDIVPTMLIYPNPAKDKFNIVVSGKEEQTIQLKIYNSTGQLVYICSGKGIVNEEISLEDNKSGLYSVIAVVDNKLIIQKVLVE